SVQLLSGSALASTEARQKILAFIPACRPDDGRLTLLPPPRYNSRRAHSGGTAMSQHDLVIRNGTVATAADTTRCDVAIKDGTVVALGQGLAAGARDIDASGRLVLPGAIDSHCHIEQKSSAGVMCADDFYSATVS